MEADRLEMEEDQIQNVEDPYEGIIDPYRFLAKKYKMPKERFTVPDDRVPKPASSYKTVSRDLYIDKISPRIISEETRKKYKVYTFTIKNLLTGYEITPSLEEYRHFGETMDFYCPDVLSWQFFFYRNKFLPLDFFDNTAEEIYESGIFQEEVPVIEYGTKFLFWFRVVKCGAVSLIDKIVSYFNRNPRGYQEISKSNESTNKIKVE